MESLGSTGSDGSRPSLGLDRDWLQTLLERVADRAGATPTLEAIRRAVTRAERWMEAHPLTTVERAVTDLGLRARMFEGTVADLRASVGPEHPAVAVDDSGGWILVVGRQGFGTEVETWASAEPRVLSRDGLHALLPEDAAGTIRWLAIDPPSLLPANDGPTSSHPTSPWLRLQRLVTRERQDIVVVLLYAVGAGLLTLATPIAVQALVNTVAFGTLLQPVLVLSVLLLAGLAFAGVLRALQAWVVEILQRRIFVSLVDDLSHRLPRVSLSAFSRAHGPELLNRFFDVFTIQKAASSLLIGGLEVVLTAAVGMLVLAFYHPLLLAFDVILILLVCVILFGLGRGATHTAVAESKAKYAVAGWLEEVARHPATFKLAGGPALARDRADVLAADYIQSRERHFRVVFRQLVGALSLHAFASAGILGIGGFLVIDRQLTLGQLVAAELIVTMVVASFAKVGKHLETVYDLLAALEKIGRLVDLPMESGGSAPCVANDPRGARVETRELALAPGDRALLVDRDAGQSPIVDAILGLHRDGDRRVNIDGVDLDDLDAEGLRARAALVRGADVVAGTVFDNVAFGRRGVDVTRARAALDRVGLGEEVSRLEDGIHTRLMPGGAPLSPSHALRLVVARAVAGDPALLVIDGALDGLDAETCEELLGVLLAEDATWTLLVVTHSETLAQQIDRVRVMKDED